MPDTGGQDETAMLSFNGPEEMSMSFGKPLTPTRHVIVCRLLYSTRRFSIAPAVRPIFLVSGTRFRDPTPRKWLIGTVPLLGQWDLPDDATSVTLLVRVWRLRHSAVGH